MSESSKRVSDAIKPALSNALSTQAYATLIALPGVGWVFALPVVSHLTKAILNRITEWLVQETAVGLSVLWIQVEMAYEIKSAEDATKKLKEMFENSTKYSDAEQKKIEEYFDETTLDLIQLGIKRL